MEDCLGSRGHLNDHHTVGTLPGGGSIGRLDSSGGGGQPPLVSGKYHRVTEEQIFVRMLTYTALHRLDSAFWRRWPFSLNNDPQPERDLESCL